ncbi:hypothetical protein [Paragemmobacter straminiformis]|uniref:5-carboxymethyl-2-hydroxymuconate isomerase n=1 Tax=Paragemmobacter straminiformis TaxID=2045119 RepID=A0A842I6M5_9RHOB|nr:hypothetical protein [Gemmobacter straminiformis]MBC2834608.1 hypothetical protein [Gemmobacter straminiformis]
MANVKFFIDAALMREKDAALDGLLAQTRALLCARLDIPEAACQFVAIGVRSLADQPAVNIEISLLPKPDRTAEKLRSLCEDARDIATRILSAHTAVRCAQLDAATYIAIK